MRFSLQTLLLAILAIAVWMGIAAWHPILAGIVALVAVPLTLVTMVFWRQPLALATCFALAAMVFVDLASISYSKSPQLQFEPNETNYHFTLYNGRLLAFRFKKWLPPLSSRFYFEEATSRDWKEWIGYYPPKRNFQFLGCEYARGEFIAPFLLCLMRHRVFDYTMVGIPTWFVVSLIMAIPLLRLLNLRPGLRSFRNDAYLEINSVAGDHVLTLFSGRPDRNIRRAALGCFAISVLLFLVAIGFELAPRNAAPPFPISISQWTFAIALFQAVAGFCVDIPLRHQWRHYLSITRYIGVGTILVIAGAEFLLNRGQAFGAADLETMSDLSGMRLANSIILCVATIVAARRSAPISVAEILSESKRPQ